MHFTFEKTSLDGITLIKPRVLMDDRGDFFEIYSKEEFALAGVPMEVVQVNHSLSTAGVVRGLHFQRSPYEQAKLVRCVRGEIEAIAVNIRQDSSAFGKHVSIVLSDLNRFLLFVPRGFAHGFAVLSRTAEVEYAVDNIYAPEYEGGILWSDPDLSIRWPFDNPKLSPRDKKWPPLKDTMSSL